MTIEMRAKDGLVAGLRSFVRRFVRARRGAVAVQFAAIVLPLAVLSLGLIDVNQASMSKRNLQDALDAATLMVAKSDADTNAEADAVGDAALSAQLATMTANDGVLASSTFTLAEGGSNTVMSEATLKVTPVVANLWLQGDMTVGAKSEVVRSSQNLEVALVLDVTGSMYGTPLADLKAAAAELVDLVVKDSQTPYYSKVALVPYSNGVNLGSARAAVARGAVPAAKSITGASWSTGSARSISGATRANPVVITANSHGFSNGDRIYISGVSGMTQLNGRVFTVAGQTANTFQLSGVNGASYGAYSSSSSDFATECQRSNCQVVVSATGHGFADTDLIHITGVGGMTHLNNTTWTVSNRTSNSFTLAESFGPSYSAFSSAGSAWCATAGCQFFAFENANSRMRTHQISSCVSERPGSEAYTDASPATALVGRNYPGASTPCPDSEVIGLSSNKTALKSAISGLAAEGTTAGQIGLAWGWYAVSPNFSSIFTGTSQPASYDAPEVLKVVILMTDGDFNTSYCNGVISQDSAGGIVSGNEKIGCNSPHGTGFQQTDRICEGMRARGVVVYTVGFNVSNNALINVLKQCATSGEAFLPSSGASLSASFKAIGKDISSLRISK